MIITGSIEEIRFVNSENGYHIVVLKSGGETFVATGSFPPIAEGETLRLSGEFVMHERFGRQFKSESAERIEPTGAEAVSKFLSGGLFKGIGPKTAEAITKVFGAKSLEIMENQPHLLSKIRGISPQKAQSLAEEYKKHVSAQNTVMFLLGVGLGLNLSLKIFKEYGGDAKAVVSANPYKLIEDIDGVGFATADRIARTLGIQIDALFRLKAGVICTLKDSADKGGNTFLLRDELVIEAARLLGLKGGSIESGGTGESNEDGNGGKTDGLGADTTISRQNETASCGILDAAID
ncbi:MAG: ATP-dependent RecD-like DNA helicase, partial [Firmicutes bacterium]|nr:ATP-dependent RecD-like DNA helicase [Bacillota bacterium]